MQSLYEKWKFHQILHGWQNFIFIWIFVKIFIKSVLMFFDWEGSLHKADIINY